MRNGYAKDVLPPADTDTWIAVVNETLPIGEIYEWSVSPDCGAVVLFSGVVRNYADGRTGVSKLSYEAYEEQAVARMHAIANEVRATWKDLGKITMIHRVGDLGLGESAVVTCVSSPHRPAAFEAARFCIDALKASVPIWKKEEWDGGSDWGTRSQDISEVSSSHQPGAHQPDNHQPDNHQPDNHQPDNEERAS